MATIQFDFEEMRLSGEGLMAAGKATLESDREDDSEFYVAEIILDGGYRLVPSGAGQLGFPSEINKVLFKAIASQIEDDRTPIGKNAALEWSDHIAGNVPDYTPVFKRRPGMPMDFTNGAVRA